MIRYLILLLLTSLSIAASAQVADTSYTGTPSSMSSVAAETRARDEAFAAWKVRYAANRAKVAQEIKAVQLELADISPAKATLKEQLTNLLTGSVKRWNEEKMDYADPDQFTECQDLFATIRQAIRDGFLKL